MVSDSLGVQYVPSFFCLRNAPACVILIRSTFAFEPVSEARGVGNISPHDKSSLAFMPRADGASRKYECPNCISRLFQVKERFVEPHIDEVSNIFAKHPTGAQFFNDAAHFRPEITGVGKSLFRADCGERLVILNFGITRLIPNKIRSPKPSRESLQRKDFCIKTSG